MKRKRALCLVLVLIMVICLSACEEKKESLVDISHVEQSELITSTGEWLGKGGCYKLDRQRECEYYTMKGTSDHLIFNNLENLCDQEDNILLDEFVCDYEVTEDGIWCICQKIIDDEEYIAQDYAVKIGFDGQEIMRFDIPVLAAEMAVSADKLYIFDSGENILEVMSESGTVIGQVDLSSAELKEYTGSLLSGGDDSVWILKDVDNGKTLFNVNRDSMNLGVTYQLPEDTLLINRGTTENPFLLATKTEFSYLNPIAGTATNILYWDECAIDSGELHSFISDADGFLCLTVTGVSRLRPAQAKEIEPRKRLTLATVYEYDDSTSLAATFNSKSDDYYVEVIDYSQSGVVDVEDALAKLNADVMSGKGPDMTMITDLDTLQNASAYLDIYPLLDADTELKREDFYGLKAMERGERLLMSPSMVLVSTFGGLPEVVGNRTGWTWDEYFEMESQLPPGGVMSSYLDASFFIKSSLDLYAPQAIDWEDGTCNFDTPEFVSILDAAKRGYDPNCPEENPYYSDEVNSMMADKSMILSENCFFDVDSFIYSDQMNGRELSYVGWPTPDGSCGSVFELTGVAVFASTKSQEGCWEFTKDLLMSSYLYKPTFEAAIQKASTPKKGDVEGKNVMTQSQAERYRTLMENITVAASSSGTISSIVLEEASAMFAGNQSPEDTARLIQSRMSLYVAEHK